MQSILITLNDGELAALIKEAVVAALQQQATSIPTTNPPKSTQETPLHNDVMLTRNDIAVKFGISLTTVDTWNKKKWIRSTKIGGRRFFRQSDVEKLFEQKGVKRG